MQKKPVEYRALSDSEGTSVGRLRMWIDAIEKEKINMFPSIKIMKPPRYEFELRVIIWSTKNCVFKDEIEKCNDTFVKANVGNQSQQETDVHWRCRG
jgi:hypothetical protein